MDAFRQTDSLLQQGLEQGAYPSAAVAVGIGPRVYLKKCYGGCTEHTLFDIASLSKILGPTMIAFRFLEDGLLRLYDTVGDFFPDAPEDKKAITILQLMSHTGGFPAHFFLSDHTSDPAEAAWVILEHPLALAPGTAPVYSCMGYILLGRILEKIGGAPLDALAERLVFHPLGMAHTGYHPDGDIAPTELDPATGRLLQGIVHDENARFLGGISGNAGVFSDLNDMIRFTKMLACDGRQDNGSHYLSPAMLNAARINRTPDSRGEFRGLGFNLAGSPRCFLGDLISPRAYGHTGFTGTSIAVDPETGLWVVLLTNRVCPTRANTQLVRMRSLIHNTAAAEASRLAAHNQ
ncbi:MAG: beta-lactamase family protein [Oscillospiraceae bacterium]|nr:beta-lactamase family protein [Oscillospiraceae bacterium]